MAKIDLRKITSVKIINSILQIDALTQERAQLQTTRDDLELNLSELKQRLENANNEIEAANVNNENLNQTLLSKDFCRGGFQYSTN